MKKHIFIIVLAAIAIVLCGAIRAEAQDFKKSGNTASELCPYEKFVTVEGDFNKDGVQDLFINVPIEACAFYFGKADGGYTLFRDYDLLLAESARLSVTDKGVLRIQFGAPKEDNDVFLFRYQDNAFVLIGGKRDRHQSDDYDESYNFLTNKKIETKGSGASRKSETSDMPKHHPLKFGWFPLDWDIMWYAFTFVDEFGGLRPDDMLSFGVYRRMQLESRVEWFMCNLERESNWDFPNLGKDGTGSVYADMMRPYMENMSVNITFVKQSNDIFKIVTEATIEDRSYEDKLDNYLSEHPEDQELTFDEQMKKANLTLPEEQHNVFTEYFVDGKFTNKL
jgi:hypothetical protein